VSGGVREHLRWITCPECGKRAYETKAIAKRTAKFMGDRMAAYRCQFGGPGWHIGHLPKQVVQGDVPRSEIRQER
jgi:hypothetical protein